MRKIIAALIVSVDGFIEGPRGEVDWIDSWEDPFDLLPQVDTFILGGNMYPGYETYWGSIIDDPSGTLPFTGKTATQGEIDYARFAAKTPHIVLSGTLESPKWTNTRIVRTIDDIRELKAQPGADMHAVGGAGLIGSLMNADLIDEIRLVVHPIVLGGGMPLFRDVQNRRPLTLVRADTLPSGQVRLIYSVQPAVSNV